MICDRRHDSQWERHDSQWENLWDSKSCTLQPINSNYKLNAHLYEQGRWPQSQPSDAPPWGYKTQFGSRKQRRRRAIPEKSNSLYHDNLYKPVIVKKSGHFEGLQRSFQNQEEPKLKRLERHFHQFAAQSWRNPHQVKELLELVRQRLDQIDLTLRSSDFRFLLLSAKSLATSSKEWRAKMAECIPQLRNNVNGNRIDADSEHQLEWVARLQTR